MPKALKGIVSNPNLAPYIKESVLAYQEEGILQYFFTSFCNKKWLTRYQKILPHTLINFLKRRSFDHLNPQHLRTYPLREIIRILATKYAPSLVADYIWEWSELSFDALVAKKLNKNITFFHGYEHACLACLKQAKTLRIPTIYEQPSQHHQYFSRIVTHQLAKYPVLYSPEVALLNDDKAQRRNRRRDEELQWSDWILCNSTFTKGTLIDAGIPIEKIFMIPYGFPVVKPIAQKSKITFHFIYAGNLSLRKGIHLLLAAWKLLPSDLAIQLTLMGSSQLPDEVLHPLPPKVDWIQNLPHQEAQQKIAESNVLLLPTLADGFGMVITESMALGVPVICTKASAGPDLIENYEDGICIPSDDIEALKKAILWCIEHPKETLRMGEKAQEKAAAYPWAAYRKQLVKEIKSRCDVG